MNEATLKPPHLVLCQGGTNDALAAVPVEAFTGTGQKNLRPLTDNVIDKGLIGLQDRQAVANSARHQAFSRAISELAAEENVLLVRRYDAMRFVASTKWEGLLSGDGLHQNDHGYHCMAEHIAHAVVASAFAPDESTAPTVEEA